MKKLADINNFKKLEIDMKKIRKDFGNKLKQYRKAAKITQKELAMQISVDDSAVCYYETGRNLPRLKELIKICAALNISLNDFLLVKEK